MKVYLGRIELEEYPDYSFLEAFSPILSLENSLF